MNIKETGLILFTENYKNALAFYVNKLGLRVRQSGDDLSFLEFGNSYLIIEGAGVSSKEEKTREQNPICLRIDVYDFEETVSELVDRGVKVDIKKFEWGTIGVIIDPEGNRIEIKDGI